MKVKIGLYSLGLKTYWNQFKGLKDRLVEYNKFIENKLSSLGEVYNFGLVDDMKGAYEVSSYLNKNEVDIIFLHSATYFTSDVALKIHQLCSAPVVILNLQPSPQINYDTTDTGEWLAQCIACPIPEVSNAFERANIKFRCINGLLGLDYTPDIAKSNEITNERKEAIKAWNEIEEWVKAAYVKSSLNKANFGFLGDYYSGMLDMYSDFTQLSAQIGIHVETLEMCDLDEMMKNISEEEIKNKLDQIKNTFEISEGSKSDSRVTKPSDDQLHWSAKVAVAEEKLVKAHELDALSYYYHSVDNNPYEDLQSGLIVGNSLLTATHVPCAGEGDIKTCLAMKICDLVDTGGSFCEIVVTDYINNTILIGHDGPFHIKISDQKPILRGLGVYHGKKGSGVSVEAKVKEGDVTTLNVTQLSNGKLKFIVSEAYATNDKIMQIGNTQTHVRFKYDVDEYMDKWFKEAPTHHCALSVGHNASLFQKIGDLLNIETVVL